jgi:hypothetical protein
MTYRNDLGALAARKDALEIEVRDRQRELDEASRMVDEFHARARLPVLDNIRIAEPCTARWSQMAGDDRVRACGDCNKNVYNLSSLTRDEAEALIIEKEGKLCVRYFQRADGTILLKDCAVGVQRRRRRRWMALGVAASIAGAAFSYLRTREPMVMMGAVRAPRGFIGEPGAPEIRYAQPPGHVKVGELRQSVIQPPRPPRPTMGVPVFHPPATKAQR